MPGMYITETRHSSEISISYIVLDRPACLNKFSSFPRVLGSLHHKQHQKGRSCPMESSQICCRRLSLHKQCHCHDREPLVGNPPTQKTASQGHYDVSYCTCHGSYTSLSTPPAFKSCYKRSPVQVQSHTAGPIHTRIPSSRKVSDCGTQCRT